MVVVSDLVPRCLAKTLKVAIKLLDNNFLEEIMLVSFSLAQSIK